MGVSAVRTDGSVAPVLNVVGEAVRRHTGVEPVMVVQGVRALGDGRRRVRLVVEIDTAEDPLDAQAGRQPPSGRPGMVSPSPGDSKGGEDAEDRWHSTLTAAWRRLLDRHAAPLSRESLDIMADQALELARRMSVPGHGRPLFQAEVDAGDADAKGAR